MDTNVVNAPTLAPVPSHVPADRIMNVDLYSPDGLADGYYEAWKRLQAPGVPDLVWTPYNGGHWIATRGAWIREIYKDPEHFSSEVIWIPKEAGEKYTMIPTRMDPPEHTPFRDVLNKGLNLREIRRIEDAIRKVSVELIEEMLPNGRCDFSLDYAQIFPIRVFLAMANLPMADAPVLKVLARQMTRPEGETPAEMAATLEKANKGFNDYVSPYIDARMLEPGNDLISTMVNSKVGDRPMTKDEALGLISLLLLAGLDTVVNFLSFFMIFLSRNPDHLKQLTDNPASIPQSTEELFRRFPLVAEGRMVAQDITRDGVELKQGEMVLLPTALAGLDDRENENPMEVDFRRKKIQHTTFGDGPHRCAGMHLARMEVTVTLQEWLARIPVFKMVDGARPSYFSGIVAAVENVPLEWPVS